MRVVVAHRREGERQRIGTVLAGVGHEVLEAADEGEALARCLEWAPDVAILESAVGESLLERIKGDAHAFGTAVVLVEPAEPGVERALEVTGRGVQDILVEPVRAAELLTRVHAAGCTKVLQEELIAQADRLEALIFEDPLTGLSNRRFILTQLGGLISGARRHDRALGIAIIDIDHFKAVNDTHGHAEGDRVLAAVAHALRSHLRAEDQLGRLGGEEFLALLPDADARAARAAAEKMRASVARTGVTVSIGWAAWDGERPEELLRRSDDALYVAKARGRDCAVGAPATLPRRT
ncbi:MAG: diguanylate cyclase domain-containing protein [Solirubrobacteraceae bacterium]